MKPLAEGTGGFETSLVRGTTISTIGGPFEHLVVHVVHHPDNEALFVGCPVREMHRIDAGSALVCRNGRVVHRLVIRVGQGQIVGRSKRPASPLVDEALTDT